MEEKIFNEEHNGIIYTMRRPAELVIDDYDEDIDSVELSHYEEQDYNVVENFDSPAYTPTIDLTWMNEDDIFKLESSEKYLELEEMIVNIDNLGFSSIPSGNDTLNLKISGKNAKSNSNKQVQAFEYFISNNKVKNVTLADFRLLTRMKLMKIAKAYGTTVTKDSLTEEQERHR